MGARQLIGVIRQSCSSSLWLLIVAVVRRWATVTVSTVNVARARTQRRNLPANAPSTHARAAQQRRCVACSVRVWLVLSGRPSGK